MKRSIEDATKRKARRSLEGNKNQIQKELRKWGHRGKTSRERLEVAERNHVALLR